MFDRDLNNLDDLIRSIDQSQVLGLARRMYSANHITLIGGDLAATLVRFLEHHLMILGLPASCATSPAEVVHKMRFAGKKDLVIAITYGRGLRQTVEGLRQARANNAYCVAITNTALCPITQFAHESFFTNIDSPSFGPSYVAPMAFFNVLIAPSRMKLCEVVAIVCGCVNRGEMLFHSARALIFSIVSKVCPRRLVSGPSITKLARSPAPKISFSITLRVTALT